MNEIVELIEIDCFGCILFKMRVDFTDSFDEYVSFEEDIIELAVFQVGVFNLRLIFACKPNDLSNFSIGFTLVITQSIDTSINLQNLSLYPLIIACRPCRTRRCRVMLLRLLSC